MSDLDLWVPSEQLDEAVNIAGGAGLRYSSRLADRSPTGRDLRLAKTRVVESPQSSVVVEIHGALNSLHDMSPEWHQRTWARRERRSLGEMQVWVMHPEDMLTHLVIHCGRNDRFKAGLRPLLDIALWLRSDGNRIEWQRLLADWEREGIATWALLPIELARDLFGAAVPGEVVQRIGRISGFDELCEVARQQVFGALETLPPTMTHLVSSTSRERASWIFTRLTTWYWKGPPGVRRSAAQVLGDAARRIGHDLRHKTVPYMKGLLQGHFWGGEFSRRREVVLGRQRLADLVEKIESANPSRPPI
jgi:hypothetical protein